MRKTTLSYALWYLYAPFWRITSVYINFFINLGMWLTHSFFPFYTDFYIFLSSVNSIDRYIQFTFQIENDKNISFLNVLISEDIDWLPTTVFKNSSQSLFFIMHFLIILLKIKWLLSTLMFIVFYTFTVILRISPINLFE